MGIPQSAQISFTDLNSQLLGCLGEQYSNRNPSPETQAFLLLPLGKGGTPYGLYFDRDYCENTTYAPQEVCGHTVGVAFAKGESAE